MKTNTEQSILAISIASDHAGYQLKSIVIEHLSSLKEYLVVDLGVSDATTSVDYPDIAGLVSKSVSEGATQLGILICGTGIGMTIAANKYKGIRCALCSDAYSARLTRQHNDANVLALGARVLGTGLALDIVDSFLDSQYMGESRHADRIAKISKIERN
jgi:ribose 5-phosphate isomerase B